MILVDLHLHPSAWNQQREPYYAFVETALTRHIDIIGFLEHGPPIHPDPKYYGLTEEELENYVSTIFKLKEEFRGDLQIFCGLELDYHPDRLTLYDKIKSEYPFDYFLGSVHLIEDWHLDDPASLARSAFRTKSLPELYQIYYRQIVEAAQCGLFSGLAHLDYLRRSLPHPPGQPPNFALDLFYEVAAQLAATGIIVEVNTRGLSLSSSSEIHPTRPLLKALARAGVRFTLGSDAHERERVGAGLGKSRRILRKLGIESICYFRRFQVCEIDI